MQRLADLQRCAGDPKRSNLTHRYPKSTHAWVVSPAVTKPFIHHFSCLPCAASRIHTRLVLPKPETKHKILQTRTELPNPSSPAALAGLLVRLIIIISWLVLLPLGLNPRLH